MEASLSRALIDFAKDYCDFLPPRIEKLKFVPSSTQFLNDYVTTSTPFIMDCLDHSVMRLDIHELWKEDSYLLDKMGLDEVTVAVTPFGNADGVDKHTNQFFLPEERRMTMCDFLSQLSGHSNPGVYYLQKQNNNFVDEFPLLHEDMKIDIPWATCAFGKKPDATNIWIGNADSCTSMHKDSYENLYYVITGQKTFTLYPPVAAIWMPYQSYKKFQYHFNWDLKVFDMVDCYDEVDWIAPDKTPENESKRLMEMNTKRYVVNVNAGQALYLPALWFHEVKQTDRTISVNYWYDMKYEVKYPYFCLLKNLSNLLKPHASTSIGEHLDFDKSISEELSKVSLSSPSSDTK